jgi:hypothetical protein
VERKETGEKLPRMRIRRRDKASENKHTRKKGPRPTPIPNWNKFVCPIGSGIAAASNYKRECISGIRASSVPCLTVVPGAFFA